MNETSTYWLPSQIPHEKINFSFFFCFYDAYVYFWISKHSLIFVEYYNSKKVTLIDKGWVYMVEDSQN